MVASLQHDPTQELRTAPRVRILPPASDLAEATERSLLRSLLGQSAIPSRPFTASEHTAITLLRTILQEGRWTGTWSDVSFEVAPGLAQRCVDDFAGDTVRGLDLLGPDAVLDLSGRGISLGPQRLVFLQARLANQRAVRAQLARQLSHDVAIELRFSPAENTMVEGIYAQQPSPLQARTTDAFDVLLDDYLRVRPGPWAIRVSPPLRAPIEVPADPGGRLQGWILAIPDRVNEGLDQLDCAERSAVLAALWEVQRRGGRDLGSQLTQVGAGDTLLYALRPIPEVHVILRPLTATKMRLVEIVRTKTLKMFRER